ncbi:MAG: class I SAM-dependent methyltransferase [Halieaceae bacterium]|jgi:SAM-dependent methyltransferase|nr:class I SAM-dependent methyltransferase [Halieaceae bacterium]
MQTIDREFLPLRPGELVLDLGCGEGRHVIATAAVDGVDSIGVDLSLADLATAGARHGEFVAALDSAATAAEAPLFALLAGDALALPFPDARFDTVICSEVLEHLPDYAGALREIERVLRPGGRLCISVPRAWPERICWRLSRAYHQTKGGHLRIFDASRLRREIEALGFDCYQEHGAHALHSVYWWLQCLFWDTRDRNWLVRQYHRLLVWDMMAAPSLTRRLERILNPSLGKSVVMYFRKPDRAA